MGKPIKPIDRDQLFQMYEKEGRPVTELAAFFDCSPITLRRHLHRHGIRVRSQSEEMSGRKLSSEHRAQVVKNLRFGDEAKGANNPYWKGGRSVTKGRRKDGFYALVLIDGKYVPEHRYVVEQYIGRKLHRREHVHHKDGNKLNNDPKNLQVLTASEHAKLHMTEEHRQHLSNRMREVRSERTWSSKKPPLA